MSDMALSGLVTGLNTAEVVQQLMALEKRPVQLMQANQAKLQSKVDLYRTLNTKLSALQTAAKSVMGSSLASSPMTATKATSGDASIFTISSDNTAGAGNYSVVVNQLAKEQKTGGGAFNAGHAGGTLRISDGTTTTDIAIGAGADAATVAAAINGANATMGATVINGKLMLTGKQTGVNNTIVDAGGGSLATDLGVDTVANQIQSAQQASLTIDGIFNVTSNSNTVTNAMSGVTLNLLKAGTTTASVTADQQPATDKIKDLVAKYNDVINYISNNSKYDKDTKKAGAFLGDSFVNSLTTQLNQMFTGSVDPDAANTNAYDRAGDVGIAVNKDGTIGVDETKLKAALQANAANVYRLFANEDNQMTTDGNGATVKLNNIGSGASVGDGIANRLSAFVEQLVSRVSLYNTTDASGARIPGSLLTRLDSLQTTIDTQSKSIDAYSQRLVLREKALRNQFTAMETAVQKMRNQGNYFASSFSSLQAQSQA